MATFRKFKKDCNNKRDNKTRIHLHQENTQLTTLLHNVHVYNRYGERVFLCVKVLLEDVKV